MNNYDALAKYYDRISKMIFGTQLIRAQKSILHHIQSGQKILIVGGGTGKILEALDELQMPHVAITYLEASENMIAIARKRKTAHLQVQFVQDRAENYHSAEAFDCIITPFFFDNFRAEKLSLIFKNLDSLLKKDGLFLYTDFFINQQKKRIWKSVVLKTMYLFFAITCHIETDQLEDIRPFFATYVLLEEKYFVNGFVVSRCYQKQNALS